MVLRMPAYFWIVGLGILLTPFVRCDEELQHSHIYSSSDDDDDNVSELDDLLENDEEAEEGYDHHHVVIGSKREAKNFHSLTADEAKQKLAEIVKQIDVNDDKIVNKVELQAWIKENLRKLGLESAEGEFKKHKTDSNNTLTWGEYVLSQYGYSVQQLEELAAQTDEDTLRFLEMIAEDRARWTAADVNKDSELNVEEFTAFLFPYNYEHTQNYEADRVIGQLDASADGSIDLKEFQADDSDNEDVKERFAELDKNADGRLERSEVRDWVAPGLDISAEIEARQLMHSTKPDANELTLSDILDHHDLWVGSQAHAQANTNSEVKSDSEASSNTKEKSTENSYVEEIVLPSHTEL